MQLSKGSGRRGQAVVEFALIIPVFLLLLLAAVDFGRMFFTYIQANNAAREGAAYGAANAASTTITFSAADADVRRAIDAVYDAGGAIIAVEPRRESLEDYFTRMLEGEKGEVALS